jgi:F420-0:gamma-glutamyl ligase
MEKPLFKPGLQVMKIKTGVYTKDQGLLDFIFASVPQGLIEEGSVFAITSKIVSIAENAVVPKRAVDGTPEHKDEKLALVKKEADRYLGESHYQVSLTIKHGILIPTAGIDESNSENSEYILFPKDPYASAKKLWLALRAHYRVDRLGILITDSHTTPLRKGVTGIALAHYGFKATRDLVGRPDLFGRSMKMTHVNVIDALAVAAVYEMGETDDACPLALIRVSDLEFTQESSLSEIQISFADDLYGKFLQP